MASGAGKSHKNRANGRNGVSKTHNLKGKKRVRGFKFKARRLVPIGEAPDEKRLKSGKVRKFNLLRPDSEDAVPRRTQELFERSGNQVSKQPSLPTSFANSSNISAKQPTRSAHNSSRPGLGSDAEGNTGKRGKPKNASTKHGAVKGIQAGESMNDFSNRLRTERRKLVFDTVRKTTHQWEKKKAHYEKRHKRLETRKKRRRGQVVEEDSDNEKMDNNDGDDTDEEARQNLSRLPMYWQEIVRNNGRPVSDKKRRRLHRLEMEELRQHGGEDAADDVQFGEQVERPPELSAVPKQRKGQGLKRQMT